MNLLLVYYLIFTFVSIFLSFVSFKQTKDILDPRVIFFLIYWLSYSSNLYSILFEGEVPVIIAYENIENMLISLSFSFFIFWLSSFFFIRKNKIGLISTGFNQKAFIIFSRNLLYPISFVMIAAFSFFAFYFAVQGVSRIEISTSTPSGIFVIYNFVIKFYMFFLLMLISFDSNLREKSWFFKIFILVIIGLFAGITIGEREPVLLLIMFSFLYYKKKISNKHILYLIIFSVTAFYIIPFVRNLNISDINLNDLSNFYQNPFPRIGANALVFSNIISMVPDAFPYFYGKSYFYSLMSFVPFDIFETKQMTPALWFAENYVFQGNSGLDFCLEAEAYMNFGFLGVPVIFSFISIAYSFFYSKYKNGSSVFFLVIYPPLFVVMLQSVRTHSLTVFKSLAAFFILYIILYVIFVALKKGSFLQKKKF